MVEKYKIVHDREACIGCGACASVCPSSWEMNSDGKSDLINAKKNEEGLEVLGSVNEPLTNGFNCNNEAAESCPVNCIHIYEIKEDNSENKLI